VEAFGNFVAGADPVIGFVIFTILIIVNFIVITKGAGRVSEVAARFTLDAMPGKQMAIDADLNAGLIKEAEARERRLQVSREADFYGAMDGASKFVRGRRHRGNHYHAGQHRRRVRHRLVEVQHAGHRALHTFTILTIGDGLVSQIPALIVSLAAGLIVTRAAADASLGREMVGQLFGEKKVLWITMGFLGLLLLSAVFMGSGLPWFSSSWSAAFSRSSRSSRGRRTSRRPKRTMRSANRTRSPTASPKRSKGC